MFSHFQVEIAWLCVAVCACLTAARPASASASASAPSAATGSGISLSSNRIVVSATVTEEEEPRGRVLFNLRKGLEERLGNQSIAGEVHFAVIGEQKCSRYFNVTRNGAVLLAQKIDREALCSEVQMCCAQELGSFVDASSPILRDNFLNLGLGLGGMQQESGQCRLELEVTAHVNQLPIRFDFHVTVFDTNDNVPFWPQNFHVLQVREGPKTGHVRYPFPAAVDIDEPRHSVKSYRIVQQVPFERDPTFSVTYEGGNGERLKPFLQQNVALDRESRDWYNLTIEASDIGGKTGRLHLFVSVTDVNDNPPRLERTFYNVSVVENIDSQHLIVTVRANDSDTAANAQVRYAISDYSCSSSADAMRIEPTTGRIYLNGAKLDYEKHRTYCLIVIASDQGTPPLSASATVQINVLDIDDEKPMMHVLNEALQPRLSVLENQPVGTKIGFLQVSDADTPIRQLTCESQTDDFRLSSSTSNSNGIFEIKTNRVFDREMQAAVNIHLVCRDAQHGLANVETVTEPVEILDVNDNSPTFMNEQNGTLVVSVFEGNAPNARVLNASAFDSDAGDNGLVTYRLVDAGALFRVSNRSGEIFAQTTLDRERSSEYRFWLVAVDHGAPQRSTTATVLVRVLDVNDHAPVFSQSVYHFSVDENEKSGALIGQIYATDSDEQTENGAIDFFVNKTVEKDFEVRQNGQIFTARSFDRETTPSFNITVFASDRGQPARTSSARIRITVNDINDNKPRFYWQANSTLQISYRRGTGPVTRIVAEDADFEKNGHIEYSLRENGGATFLILDPFSGELRVSRILSEGDIGIYILQIEARDSGQPSHSESIIVAVNVVETVYGDAAQAQIPWWDSNRVTSLIIFLSIISMTLALILIATFVIIIRCRIRARSHFGSAGRGNDKAATQRPIADARGSSRCGSNTTRSTDDLPVINYAPIIDFTHIKPIGEDASESDVANYLDDVEPRYSALFNAPIADLKESLPAFNQSKFRSISVHNYDASPMGRPKSSCKYSEVSSSATSSSCGATFRRKTDSMCSSQPSTSNECALRRVNLSVCRNMLDRSVVSEPDTNESAMPLNGDGAERDRPENMKPEDVARLASVHIESQAFLPSV